jgi:hypothetical protein
MALTYACVASGDTILAEVNSYTTNNISIAAKCILEKIPPTVDTMTYSYKEYVFCLPESQPQLLFPLHYSRRTSILVHGGLHVW